MYELPLPDRARISELAEKLVPPHLLNIQEGGIERNAHVTVAFGFDPDPQVDNDLAEVLANADPFPIELGALSLFERDDYLVLKAEVKSDELEDLHHRLRGYFGPRLNVTFPDYHPHLTLAYTKPACEVRALSGDMRLVGETFMAKQLVYSIDRDGRRQRRLYLLGQAPLSESIGQFLA